MNNKKTASQLRFAAGIIETGHPWKSHPQAPDTDIYEALREEWEIRIVLATPPDGRPLHNPDNLTAEQVGAGYRLLVVGETLNHDAERWLRGQWLPTWRTATFSEFSTYRRPLSFPWPPVPADPYAYLKAAQAAGKVIQFNPGDSLGWRDHPIGDFTVGPEYYRIKPDAPPFKLPPPPPGMRWHREDGWKEGDLPPGTRPLVEDEEIATLDECRLVGEKEWSTSVNQDMGMASCCLYRTTHPLAFTHAGKQWTWHRVGDPMPCDGERKVHVFWVSDEKNDTSEIKDAAKNFNWSKDRPMEYLIIGWRYAEPEPATREVELGPEDVPPGSVFRGNNWQGAWLKCWVGFTEIQPSGVVLSRASEVTTWETLMFSWQINRSHPLTGKWNPDAWEPCSKQVQL